MLHCRQRSARGRLHDLLVVGLRDVRGEGGVDLRAQHREADVAGDDLDEEEDQDCELHAPVERADLPVVDLHGPREQHRPEERV